LSGKALNLLIGCTVYGRYMGMPHACFKLFSSFSSADYSSASFSLSSKRHLLCRVFGQTAMIKRTDTTRMVIAQRMLKVYLCYTRYLSTPPSPKHSLTLAMKRRQMNSTLQTYIAFWSWRTEAHLKLPPFHSHAGEPSRASYSLNTQHTHP